MTVNSSYYSSGVEQSFYTGVPTGAPPNYMPGLGGTSPYNFASTSYMPSFGYDPVRGIDANYNGQINSMNAITDNQLRMMNGRSDAELHHQSKATVMKRENDGINAGIMAGMGAVAGGVLGALAGKGKGKAGMAIAGMLGGGALAGGYSYLNR